VLLVLLGLATPALAQGLPESLDDLRTVTAVRLALAADPFTSAVEPVVHARAGAVVIDATWPSTGAETRAAALAAAVPGVVSVAMGDAPPQRAESLGTGVALEPDEPIMEAVEPESEPVLEPLPVQNPTQTSVPQPELAPADAPEPLTHTVRLGDTLYSIARRYETTVAVIQRLNGMGDSTTLALGQRLRVR
jgi:LysM repeat protein